MQCVSSSATCFSAVLLPSLETRRIGLHAEIHSCFLFCLCTHFPGIDNPQTLAPHVVIVHSACTVATSVRYSTSTDGSIPVLSRNLLLVTDTRSRALFFVSLTDRLETPFNARRWHLASRCARDVNERNAEGPRVFPPCQWCIWLLTTGLDNHRKSDDGNNHYWAVR